MRWPTGISVVSRGDPLGDRRRCCRGWSRRRRRSPRRRSARSASSWRSAFQSCRSPSSVLGGKNSNENDRPPPASSSRIVGDAAGHDARRRPRAMRARLPATAGPSASGRRDPSRHDSRSAGRATHWLSRDATARTRSTPRTCAARVQQGARRLPRPRRPTCSTRSATTSRPLMDALGDLLARRQAAAAGVLLLGLARRRRRRRRPAIVTAAAALELFQARALIHDDVMDGSDTRRGQPAVHRRFARLHRGSGWHGVPEAFGVAAAILLGDLCLSWSDEMYAGSGLPPSGSPRGRAGLRPDAHRADGRAVPRPARAGARRRRRSSGPCG